MTPSATTRSKEGFLVEHLLRIPNKEGVDVDFRLNEAQALVDANLTGRDIIPKARQEGVSSYFLARYLVACLAYRNTKAVVISHDMESTQRLLTRVAYYIENIKGPKPVVRNQSKDLITFPKMGSMFFIGTAGSRKFGRGDTITHLHCSEYAFWPNAKEIMVGLMQAVPKTGEICLESTGNGYNDYYRRCMRAAEGKSIWRLHFLPWHTFSEYQMELTGIEKRYLKANLNEDWEERQLIAQGISLEKLAWRRLKLDELDYDLGAFKQEYPSTLDECFQMSSESIFVNVLYEPTSRWQEVSRGYWVLEDHPQQGLTYTAGVDVAAGVGQDSSVIEIFCLETGEQVAEYTNNRIDPEAFAGKVEAVCQGWQAYVTVEQNNHGILTLATLKKSYPNHLLHSDPATATNKEENRLFNLGYKTTVRNKPLMIGRLRTLLAKEWTIHSPLLKSQLSTFIEHENGKLEAQEGCEDDLVMAAACAGVGSNRAALLASPGAAVTRSSPTDPFILEGLLEELRGAGERFPIRPQHATAEWN